MRIGYSGPVRLFAHWSLLRSMRVSNGLTQAELAALVGSTRETISSLERARSLPSVTLAIAIARELGTTVEELFGD